MSSYRKKDVVKNSLYPYNFQVLEVNKWWVKCEGIDEHGERIVKEFSPDSLKLVSKNPSNGFVMGLTEKDF